MVEWKLISTAPKDGSVFLAFAQREEKRGMTCACFKDGSFIEPITGIKLPYLTHWKPLPTGPENEIIKLRTGSGF